MSYVSRARRRRRVKQTFDAAGIIAADGTLHIDAMMVPPGFTCELERIHVHSDSVLQTECNVFRNSAIMPNLIDHTSSGNHDISDEFSVPALYPGEKIIVEWIDGTPGATCTVNIQCALVG